MAVGKTDAAYDYIKKKILTGEIPPLTDLSEEKLQRELGISRTPIREAILRLGKEGFVYVFPRKGMIVSEVTKDLIEEIYEVRLLSEPHISVRASQMISSQWLMDMKERLLNPPAGFNGQELKDYFIELDSELHLTILENCENRFLLNEMKTVYDHNQRIRLKASNPRSDKDNSVNEHIMIIDAMLSKDPERIEACVLEHIINSKKISSETL